MIRKWLRARRLRSIPTPRSVSVTLLVESDVFVKGMDRAVRSTEHLAWLLRLRREREAARVYLDDLLDEAWSRYGWERPS
jgi:hypothetical protein